MQRSLKMFLILASSALASSAFGHGFELALSGNTIVPTEDTVLTRALDGANSSSHGGIEMVGAFGTDPDLQIEFDSGVWFSNGGAATPSLVSISASSTLNSSTATISGAGASPAVLDVDGTDTHEILWQLLSAPAPGVYGFSYRAIGGNSDGPFSPSPLLTVLFHTADFVGDSNLAAAQAAVAAAVPEPASLGLLILGTSTLMLVRRRSGRRQR
jgi:hypothetical protein